MSSFELVNGYICHNCTDIDYAKRHIDPQHPKDGPYGLDKDVSGDRGPAVVLGGSLSQDRTSRPGAGQGVAAVNAADPAARGGSAGAGLGAHVDLTL